MRFKYIPVRSTAASMQPTVPKAYTRPLKYTLASCTEIMPLGQFHGNSYWTDGNDAPNMAGDRR
jgi:hypothetical protein